MLPQVLQTLINCYNEPGIYFIFNKCIYWFNGKRIETICFTNSEHIFDIKVKNDLLYGHFGYSNVYVLNHKKFQKQSEINEYLFLTTIVNVDGQIYDYGSDDFILKINKKIQYLPRKAYIAQGVQLLSHGLYLYYFDDNHNEKFDMITRQWSKFSPNLLIANYNCFIRCVQLLKDVFYILYSDGIIFTYDPKFDLYEKTKFRF